MKNFLKKLLLIYLILGFIVSTITFICKKSLNVNLTPLNDSLIDNLNSCYTDEELDKILEYVFFDVIEIKGLSFGEINKLNSKYAIEVLKFYDGNYYAYYRSESKLLLLCFNYMGQYKYYDIINIYGTSEDYNEISIGDTKDKVMQFFDNENYTEIINLYENSRRNIDQPKPEFVSESCHFTEDGYIIFVLYINDKVVYSTITMI